MFGKGNQILKLKCFTIYKQTQAGLTEICKEKKYIEN